MGSARPFVLLTALVALTLLVSCSGGSGESEVDAPSEVGAGADRFDSTRPTPGQAPSPVFDADLFLESPFADESIGLPPMSVDTIDEAVEWFTTPVEVTTTEVPNQYDRNVIDREIQLKSEGVILFYYYTSSKNTHYLQLVRIEDGPPLRYGISIGMSVDELVSICGRPDFRSEHEGEDVVFYLASTTFNVGFALSDGMVSTIYLWYMV